MRRVAALLLAVLCSPARGAEAETAERLAVVAGASNGGPGRTSLRYAASDAREVARVLSQLGGVRAENLILLEEPDAAALRGALARIGGRAAQVRANGRRPELFVYYSGHSDEQGLLLGPDQLSYAQLRKDLDDVPAEVRVAILDSCASGAFTRAKGGARRPAFQVDSANRVRGHAFLTSSAADEASQESDRLHASFFTHALLTGLRGAADATGDGLVTLNEAYQFAFRETLARTEATQSGPQHATYDIALVGSGEVVLTDLRRAGAVLVLPGALAGRVFVRTGADQLVAELRKLPGAPMELAIDPGEYQVRIGREGGLQEVSVALGPGQRLALPEERLAPVPLEATVARGPGALDADPAPGLDPGNGPGPRHQRDVVTLSLGAGSLRGDRGTMDGAELRSSDAAGMMAELGLARWISDRLALEPALVLRGIQGDERVANQTTTSSGSLAAGLALGAKWALPLSLRNQLFFTFGAGVGPFAGVHGTTVKTTGAPTQETSTAEWAPGGRVRLGLEYYPTAHLMLGLGASYHQIGRFKRFVGSRRDFSGLDAAATFGYGWGG